VGTGLAALSGRFPSFALVNHLPQEAATDVDVTMLWPVGMWIAI
jgi:hypothetical protein